MDGRAREKPPKRATAASGGHRCGALRPAAPARKYFLCVFIARCTSRMPTSTPVKEAVPDSRRQAARAVWRASPVVKGRGKVAPQRSYRRDFPRLPGSLLHRKSRPACLSRGAALGARGPKRRDRRRRRPNDRCRAARARSLTQRGWPGALADTRRAAYTVSVHLVQTMGCCSNFDAKTAAFCVRSRF